MTMVDIDTIKRLREENQAPLLECRRALAEAGGDLMKARELLRAWAVGKMEKREERPVSQGVVAAYTHHNGKVGALVELLAETDFVARNEEFKKLAYELALQVASMNPQSVKELLAQEYIREPGRKVGDLVKEVAGKFGENIKVSRLARFEVGK